MSYIIPAPVKIEFPEQISLSDSISGSRHDVAASESAVNELRQQLLNARYEVGDIRIWTKPLSDIPSGWQLCDGTNGTPDMTDRAVVGAGKTYTQHQLFGADSVTPVISVDSRTLSTAQLPHHSHGLTPTIYAGAGTDGNPNRASGGVSTGVVNTTATGSSASHTHGVTSTAVKVHQPSIAVYWIMKVK
jgi:microcystin-dependent protein